jgi:hypothetical protein
MLSVGGDESGAEIGEVRAEHLGGANATAVADGAGQHHDAVPECAYRVDKREAGQLSGVPAGTGGHQYQAVGSGRCRLGGELDAVDVREHQPAVAVHFLDHFPGASQGGDDDRCAVLDHQRQVLGAPRIGRNA